VLKHQRRALVSHDLAAPPLKTSLGRGFRGASFNQRNVSRTAGKRHIAVVLITPG
jgi:hypothetical protein